jgi:hypothetical protein
VHMTWLAYAIAGECPDAVAAMSIPKVPECVAAPVVGPGEEKEEVVNTRADRRKLLSA